MLKYTGYIWVASEFFHGKEKAQGDGKIRVMLCWYPDGIFPSRRFFISCIAVPDIRKNAGMKFSKNIRAGEWAGNCCL